MHKTRFESRGMILNGFQKNNLSNNLNGKPPLWQMSSKIFIFLPIPY